MADEIVYQLATQDDHDIVRQFLMDNFRVNEPSAKGTNITEEEFLPVVEAVLTRSLRDPFSTIARHNPTGHIVGVLIQSVWRRPTGPQDNDYEFDAHPDSSVAAIGFILNGLHNAFWGLVPDNVNTVLHREMSSVHVDFQRRGIATRLASANNDSERLKAYSIDGFVSETSSLANQILLKKMGYTLLTETYFRDVVGPTGVPLIPDTEGTTKIELNWKAVEATQ